MSDQINAAAAVNTSQQASDAYSNDSNILTQKKQRVDELNALILNPVQQAEKDKLLGVNQDDNDLRPQDKFEPQGAQVQPPPLVKQPEVGPPVAQAPDNVVLPVSGRGGAVALQEYLYQLQKQGDQAAFDKAASALGVDDSNAFRDTVAAKDALKTFAAIDHTRVAFTDQNFNEISPDNVSSFANAQLVIKSGSDVPIDPTIHNPQLKYTDVSINLQNRVDHAPDNLEQLLKRQTESAAPKAVDQSANVQS